MPEEPIIPSANCPPFAGASARDLLAGILLASGGSATAIPNTTQCREWGYGRYTERDLLAAILLAVESGGGGGGPFLPLAGGTMDTNADIAFDNGSRIHQNPSANGIDQVCSIDYVHRWSSGLLYILDQINQIRVVKYGMSLVPDAFYDSTQGYIVGSIFEQDGGNRYICTDDTPTAAVWIPFGASLIPTNALEYKVVGGAGDVPYFSVKLNDGTVDIGEAIFGFRGDGSGGGEAFIQGSQEFRIEKNGGGLATILAEAFRVLGSFTNASNYRQINLSMSPSGVGVLRPEGAGTGATGNVLHISGLPTSNPGPGILWNNLGIPAIGT